MQNFQKSGRYSSIFQMLPAVKPDGCEETACKRTAGRVRFYHTAIALLMAALLCTAAVPSQALPASSQSETAADFETLYRDSKKPSVTIHCSYPRFTRIPDDASRNRINQEIQEYADSVLVKGEILQRQTQGAVTGQLDFQVCQVLDFVSVRFEGTLTGPDNRTQQLIHAINLDPATGETITLYNLWEKICFKASATAEFSRLNQIFQETIAENGDLYKLQNEDDTPVLSHDQPFYLQDNSVILCFEEDTLFPAAMGRVEISLSIDMLQQAVTYGMHESKADKNPS